MNQLTKFLVDSILNEGEDSLGGVALFGGGFKPPTKGHLEVILQGLEENPEVKQVYILVGSGERNGITQTESVKIWEMYKRFIPVSTQIIKVQSPFSYIKTYLQDHQDEDVYVFIGARLGSEEDDKDAIERSAYAKKYSERVIPLKITTTGGVSGTKARQAALSGNTEEFLQYFPSQLTDSEKEEITQMITGVIKEIKLPNLKTLKSKFKTFLDKVKQEGKETKDAFNLLIQAAKGEKKLTDLDKQQIKEQLKDILKAVFGAAVFALPAGTLVILLLKLFKLEGIVTPSSFIKPTPVQLEAIVGNKIECDGCDWSWNIKDGGDDLFICHKCWHDNTPMLNENASYSKNINIQEKIDQLTQHMLDKGYNIEPLPTVEFVDGDIDNATQFLGKTAYYDPNERKIVLYTEGRHPKDIVRSYSHEMIHHIQNLEGRLGNITTTNTQEDDELNKIEAEANLKGTMTFRNWTDSLNEDIGNPPGGEYDVNWLHDMVMQGKKDLHFLVTKHPMVNTQTEINLLKIYENMPDFKILKVDKKDGDAWIAYRNTPTGKKKAKRLKEIADSHDGYLNDKTPDEAREIGKLLDYSPADTEKYIKRRYNLNESEEQQLNVFGGDAAPESQPKMPFEERLEYYKNYYTNVSPSIFDVVTENGTIVIGGLDKSYPKDFNDVDDTRQVPVDESNKPYKHKHGFDDKLGNDPFGLNQYARELAQGLEEEILSEGKYDKLANVVSRTAFTFFKEIHDSGKTEGKTKISVGEDGDIPSDQFEFDLELYVEITDDLYQPDGGANAGYDEEGDEIQPLLNIAFKIPKNPVWSTISMDLKDIARHELEHLTQDGENLRPGKYMQDDQLARDLIKAKMLPKSQYFKLEKEVDAMLQGLYYRAKKEKLPFKDVINNYFQRVGLSKEDQKVILKIWRSRRGALSLPTFENK